MVTMVKNKVINIFRRLPRVDLELWFWSRFQYYWNLHLKNVNNWPYFNFTVILG